MLAGVGSDQVSIIHTTQWTWVFHKNRFIANSKDQLLHTIRDRKLLSQSELTRAIKNSGNVKTLVTVKDTDI